MENIEGWVIIAIGAVIIYAMYPYAKDYFNEFRGKIK